MSSAKSMGVSWRTFIDVVKSFISNSDEKEEMQTFEEIDTKTIGVTEKELKVLKESKFRLDKLAEKYRIDPENQKTKEKTQKSRITTVSKKENLKSVNEKQDEKERDER